jgi:hypothetical protein
MNYERMFINIATFWDNFEKLATCTSMIYIDHRWAVLFKRTL